MYHPTPDDGVVDLVLPECFEEIGDTLVTVALETYGIHPDALLTLAVRDWLVAHGHLATDAPAPTVDTAVAARWLAKQGVKITPEAKAVLDGWAHRLTP